MQTGLCIIAAGHFRFKQLQQAKVDKAGIIKFMPLDMGQVNRNFLKFKKYIRLSTKRNHEGLHTTKACGKRAGLCVIEVCSSLFIFITWDRTKVFICPPATSQTL
jgi:hypothetical protein